MSFDDYATCGDSDMIRRVAWVHIDAREVFSSSYLHPCVSYKFLDFHIEDVTVGEDLVC